MNPGNSRSRVQSDHALIAPDSHVLSAIPGWSGTECTILISPHMGAAFTQFIASMGQGASAGQAPDDVQRFLFVLDGEVSIEAGGSSHPLLNEYYAYLPANLPHTIHSSKGARLMVFEKPYEPTDGVEAPEMIIRNAEDLEAEPYMGDPDALLKTLLPDELPFDMAMNLFSFKPGATLPFVEVHVMEHGLLVLDGQGVYRLSDSWYCVEKGDVIWMAPYCPQYYVASGKTNTRYLYYKDMNRHPLDA